MRAYLGLGSNLGERAENLRRGVRALAEKGVRLLRASGLYQSSPVGLAEQPDFCNAVVEVETGATVPALLRLIKEIEREMGGRPQGAGRARYLDIDILLFGEMLFSSADLVLPHPRMWGRRFVLEPLMELEPGLLRRWQWALPTGGEESDWREQEVRRIAEGQEWLPRGILDGTEVGGCDSPTARRTLPVGR